MVIEEPRISSKGKHWIAYKDEKTHRYVKPPAKPEKIPVVRGPSKEEPLVTYAEPPVTFSPRFDKAFKQAEIQGYIRFYPQMRLEELSEQFAAYANRRGTHYYPTEKQLSALQWELWMSKH